MDFWVIRCCRAQTFCFIVLLGSRSVKIRAPMLNSHGRSPVVLIVYTAVVRTLRIGAMRLLLQMPTEKRLAFVNQRTGLFGARRSRSISHAARKELIEAQITMKRICASS